MSAERSYGKGFSGMVAKVYFLACVDHYKLLLMVYSTEMQKSWFTMLFFFSKPFYDLPVSHGIKPEVLTTIYKALNTWPLLPSCSPATQDTWSRLLLQVPPCTLCPQPWELCSQLSSWLTPTLHSGVCVKVCLSEMPAHHCYLLTLLFFFSPLITIWPMFY